MFSLSLILKAVIAGVLLGGIYSFVALGLTFIFGVMKIINFAHGALLMMSMYFSFWLSYYFHIDPYVGTFIIAPAFFLIGWLIRNFLLQPVSDLPEHAPILITLGLALFLENFALFLWGPDFRSVSLSYQQDAFTWGTVTISYTRLVAFLLIIIITCILYFFLKKTDIGTAIRATAEEKEGAILMGVDYRRICCIAFGIGVACLGVAGSIISPIFVVEPYIGNSFLLMAFVVVIMGGLGNFWGALASGLIVGITENLGAIFMPGSTKQALPFGLLILIMLFRPSGLLGTKR